jgi:hypothetical protein
LASAAKLVQQIEVNYADIYEVDKDRPNRLVVRDLSGLICSQWFGFTDIGFDRDGDQDGRQASPPRTGTLAMEIASSIAKAYAAACFHLLSAQR